MAWLVAMTVVLLSIYTTHVTFAAMDKFRHEAKVMLFHLYRDLPTCREAHYLNDRHL